MYKDVIGVLGGMGSYATLHFFQELLDAFPAEKEWDRPRIIIDNRCTMPSRVLAVLEGIQYDQLVAELCNSVASLLHAGATKIILACNTSHCFYQISIGMSRRQRERLSVLLMPAAWKSLLQVRDTFR